ncbi:hypothetical protein ACJQWK_11758 [Exserohilum turcicum]
MCLYTQHAYLIIIHQLNHILSFSRIASHRASQYACTPLCYGGGGITHTHTPASSPTHNSAPKRPKQKAQQEKRKKKKKEAPPANPASHAKKVPRKKQKDLCKGGGEKK